MRKLLVGGVLTLLIALMPLTVMAQPVGFEPDERASVERLVKQVGGLVVSDFDAPEVEPEIEPEGEVELPPTPEPESEGEGETEGEGEEEGVLPELDLTDLAEYTNAGITIQAPADWIVDTGESSGVTDDTAFFVAVPDTDLFMAIGTDDSFDFPSMLAVALFRSQGEALMNEFGEGAEIVESATLYNQQGLPVAKLSFTGEDDGEELAGVFYVVAPNETAYLVVAGGPVDEWAYAEPGVRLIAESMTFDEEMVTVVRAEEEPLLFSDSDQTLEVEIPIGWYGVDTYDPTFPVIIAEPEARYVVAVGTEMAFGEDYDAEAIAEMIPAEGELDEESADELLETVLDVLGTTPDDMQLDEELSKVFTREGAVTVRLVGSAEMEDGIAIPIAFYADLRAADSAAIVIFGDTDSALEFEDDLRAILESVTGL